MRTVGRQFLARSIDDAPPTTDDDEQRRCGDDGEEFGFVTLHRGDADFTFNDRDEDYPETWLEYDAAGNPRLKPYYRGARPSTLHVAPMATSARAPALVHPRQVSLLPALRPHAGRLRARPHPPRVALGRRPQLRDHRARRQRAALDARCAVGLDVFTRKLLGFTDNRQDAALQAGHFNDFLFVSLIRAGFLGALRAAGPRAAQRRARRRPAAGARLRPPCARVRAEWLQEPNLKGFNLQEAESTLRQVLAYRVWFDQRRGWRYTNPNLEQLGLVRVEYQGLDALASDEEEFESAHPVLKHATPEVRSGLPRAARPPAQVDGDQEPGARRRPSSSRWSRGRTAAFAPWGFGATRSRVARAGSWSRRRSAKRHDSLRDRTSSCAAVHAARSARTCERAALERQRRCAQSQVEGASTR
jgi:hypothetical protein